MIVLARLLTRLVGIALLALIAAVGLAAAVFCISGGHGTLSLAGLASDAHLPQVRDQTATFLSDLTAPGPVAVVALLCGVGAILLGLVLLTGAWVTPRPRRIVLARNDHGSLGSLRRPLGRLATAAAVEPEPVERARARARARRRGDGGRLRVRLRATASGDRRLARREAQAAIDELTVAPALRVRVSARRASRRERRDHRQEVDS